MAETKEIPELSIQLIDPTSCGKKKLSQFYELVLSGEQVQSTFLLNRLKSAELLAFGWIGDNLAGVACLKNPVPHHKFDVFELAGKPNESLPFTYEIGYVVTSDRYRKQSIATKLIAALIEAYSGSWFYATTKNDHMRVMLPKLGFEKFGNSYENDQHEILNLYIYKK
jgi:hypothetical protein